MIRTVREQLSRQILFSGIDSLGLVIMMAILAGASVVTQAQYWLGQFGQSGMLGSILVAVLIREAGPLLAIFVLIARSGTAMATELSSMRVRGEIDVLESQGVDPSVYLIIPRALGSALSVFGLATVLIAVSLASGFLFGVLFGVTPGDFSGYARGIAGTIAPSDMGGLLVKTLLSGFLTGVICCREGLASSGVVTDIPRAATRGVVRSIAASLIVSVTVSVLTYI